MNAAQVRKIFKKHMVPFFEEYEYKLTSSESQGYCFENIQNSKQKIVYQFQRQYTGTYELNVIICRDVDSRWPYIALTCFLDDLSFPDPTFLNGNWYFDTQEEMIGAIEEQANLFLDKAFKWLQRDEETDVMRISHERAAERARINYTGTQEEKENLLQEIRVKLEEWRQRRIKPKIWSE